MDDQEITFQARRYTKKHAKKIAAFRVLREINNRGYTFTPHQENGDAEDEDSVDTSTSSGVPSENTSAFDINVRLMALTFYANFNFSCEALLII